MSQNPSLKFYYILLVIVGIAILVTILVHEAYADTQHISIILSKTCQLSKKCISIKSLADQFDNSDKRISGEFYFDNKTNQWKRDKPLIAASILLYSSSVTPPTIFVQPDDMTIKNTKTIYIESKLPIYIGLGSKQKSDGTMTLYQNRKINECSSATIGWEQGGYDLLLDTIKYFQSDCTTKLAFNDTKVITKKLDLGNKCTKNCEYIKWLDKAKQQAKKFQVQPNKQLANNTSTCKFVRGEQICQ